MGYYHTILIAGFGGQGVLFTGKVLAYAGLFQGSEVSWLPSYGPEMRGGTANCSVTIASDPVGSPLIINPEILIAMNQPSLEKFIDAVLPGGTVIIDSTMIHLRVERTDINVCYIPATQMALDHDMKGLANLIIAGKLLQQTNIVSLEMLKKGLEKSVPPKKAHLLEANYRAIDLGMQYQG